MSLAELAEQREALLAGLGEAEGEDRKELETALQELDEVIALTRELEAETAGTGEPAAATSNDPSGGNSSTTAASVSAGTNGDGEASIDRSSLTHQPPDSHISLSAAPDRQPKAAALVPTGTSWLEVGRQVMAKWAGDGLWYEALVKVLTEDQRRATVLFDGFDESAEMSVAGNIAPISSKDMLQSVDPLLSPQQGSRSGVAGVKRPYEPQERKEREIPVSLRILPTDSEEIREQKRRRVRSIKKGNRTARQEHEQASRSAGWQSFAAKSQKSSSKVRGRQSIFRTGEGVNARVGVTNSGRGLSAQRQFDARAVQRRR